MYNILGFVMVFGGEKKLNKDVSSAKTSAREIDGGKVYFLWKAKEGEKLDQHPKIRNHFNQVQKSVIRVVHQTDLLQVIPSIGIVVERNNQKETAYVNTGEGAEVVHITASYIHECFTQKPSTEGRTTEDFMETINHELVHVYDKYKSHNLEIMKEHLDKVEELNQKEIDEFSKLAEEADKKKAVQISRLENIITIFMHEIRAEGIARIYGDDLEEKLKEENFNPETRDEKFEALYNRAKKIANNLNEDYLSRDSEGEIEMFLPTLEKIARSDDPQEIKKLVDTATPNGDFAYKIGAHVVYTLHYFSGENPFNSKLPVDKIVKLSTFQMLFKYEEIMIKNGLKPVVTVNSGKGIIDYIRMKEEISETFNEVLDVRT